MALFMSLGMFWQVGWSLALGFIIAAVIEAVISKENIQKALGGGGLKEIVLATGLGAISSSCSYAAAATSKALFKKGASFISSMAFLFSSTNLVLELGIILFLLMGWQFTVAEWIGGIVLIALMAFLVKITYPKKIIEDARIHQEEKGEHDHHEIKANGGTFWEKIKTRETHIVIAQNFVMEWSMLQKDLVIGFLIAGLVAIFVPHAVWSVLFLKNSSPVVQVLGSAFIAPIIAILTFVCSIGNVPLAAILWSQGMNFAGVLSFLYADLIVLPLLLVYKKYYGWKMMWYMLGIFFITMVLAGLIMFVPFALLHQIPHPTGNIQSQLTQFSFNYTFWLNLMFGSAVAYFIYLNMKNPMRHRHVYHEHAEMQHHQ
ncbi:MAG TPA: permease [Candidatus Paceibacterota bacterium]